MFFEFHPHVCLVKSQETHKVLLQGFVDADAASGLSSLNLTRFVYFAT